jgi:transposase InsO family protein
MAFAICALTASRLKLAPGCIGGNSIALFAASPTTRCTFTKRQNSNANQCLNEHWFLTMAHARRAIEIWRVEYNTERPHSSLGDLTPEEYAERGLARDEERVSFLTADSNPGRD